MPATKDPIIQEFEERLGERREQLMNSRATVTAELEKIDEQLAEVNSTLAGLNGHGPAAQVAKPSPAKKRKFKTASPQQEAVQKIVRENLPQDGEWHHWNPIIEKIMAVASKSVRLPALQKMPIERKRDNTSEDKGRWIARWEDGAPRVGPVASSEVRGFALAHKDGFTLDQLAKHFGRTTEWARQSVQEYVAKGMLHRKKRGSNPDLFIYQEPPNNAPSTRPRHKLDTQVHDRPRRGAPIAGTGKRGQRLPQDKDMAALCQKAIDVGCDVKLTDGDHFKISVPGQKGQIIVANTPSDHRAVLNAKNDLAKYLGVHV